jgi:glycosyltransferase involved in cell wall biosynthesis
MTMSATAAPRPGAERAAPYITVVMPGYNEEARLPASLECVIEFLSKQPFSSEIIVVDDGSRDRTSDIVRRRIDFSLSSNTAIRLVQHQRNRGKGAAIRTGMLQARGRYVFFMDADLATPPEDALRLLDRLEGGAPVAIGSRIQPDGSDMRASQPANRRFVGRLFTMMRQTTRVVPDIDDTQCPMKGFEHEAAGKIFREQRLSGWIFDAELLYIARSMGYRIVSVPVRWRHADGSRLRVRPTQAWEVLYDLVRLRFLHPATKNRAGAKATTG